MTIQKRYSVLFLAIVVVVLLISGCSQAGITTGGSSLTPLQVLQKSNDAMKQLKSSHIDLQWNAHVGSSGTSKNATPMTGIPTLANITTTIKGTGDQALPSREQLNLTINNTVDVAQIVLNDKIYVRNPQGRWYVINKSDLQDNMGNPFAGINLDSNNLLALVMHTRITDHGSELLNGLSLRHITAELDKDALRQLLAQSPQLRGTLALQTINGALDHTKSFLSTIDVWIDETQFYVHRTQLKFDMAADMSALGDTAPKNIAANLNVIVDLSKFNEVVVVTPPTNAIPTNDPTVISRFWNVGPDGPSLAK